MARKVLERIPVVPPHSSIAQSTKTEASRRYDDGCMRASGELFCSRWKEEGNSFPFLLMTRLAHKDMQKVKTTYKALKCSACKAVADEMKREVEHEWQTRAGETILIEKVDDTNLGILGRLNVHPPEKEEDESAIYRERAVCTGSC
eukprot:758385-Hanusia_phi.AAC.2